MNVESLVSEMNHVELLDAMELIWQKLSAQPESVETPDWHRKVIEERLKNPSNESLPLHLSKAEILERLNGRRTQG